MRAMWTRSVLATLTVVTLVTGCSSGGDGPSDASGQTIGEAAAPGEIDPGNFRTTPQAPFGTVSDETQGRVIEGQRLAEFVVLPSEVDPRLLDNFSGTTGAFAGANSVRGVPYTDGQVDVLARENMMLGFASNASYRADEPGVDPGTRNALYLMVMRFPDAESARRAAQGLIEQSYLPTEYSPAAVATPIDVLPDTLVSSKPTALGGVSSDSFTARGDYVISVDASAPAGRQDWVARSIATAVDRQGTLLDRFSPTPSDRFTELPIDEDEVLVLTLEQDADNSNRDRRAVYGARGAAHTSNDSTKTLEEFAKSNSDRMATDGTNVYRSVDASGAAVMYDMLKQEYLGMGFEPSAGSPGVPDSSCLSKDTTVGVQTACLLHKDRYAAELSTLEDETKAHQMTAAQYLVLDTATGS
ncbi:hypothetical protein CH275_16250 [Rhodococcus sp. 06-235-1A]|nr:hypothetical protein CH275_16250 [Rhodococcus sp. 06-235-1A]